MEMAIYFANIEALENLDEAITPLDVKKMPTNISSVLADGEFSVSEYLANCHALAEVVDFCGGELAFDRLYFGQEFCMHLIPEPAELQSAYYFARQMGWEFTYVTGYVTDDALLRVRENLDMLVEEADELEVVCNDFGILRLLREHYPQFTPILGRLLTKQLRLPRFTTSQPPVLEDGVNAEEKDFRPHQINVMQTINVGIKSYRELLMRQGISRVDLDPVPQGLMPVKESWDLDLSLYFPWSYQAGGRNCCTAALTDERRQHVVFDGACPRPCRKVNRELKSGKFDQIALLRGNSFFGFNLGYFPMYARQMQRFNRIVFQPYIPI